MDLKSLVKLEFIFHQPPSKKELLGINDNLIKLQIYSRPERFIIGLFLQTSEEVSTPTVNKSNKNDGGENRTETAWTEKQKDIRSFFTAKCKPVDLDVEQSAVIEKDSE